MGFLTDGHSCVVRQQHWQRCLKKEQSKNGPGSSCMLLFAEQVVRRVSDAAVLHGPGLTVHFRLCISLVVSEKRFRQRYCNCTAPCRCC